MIRNNTRRDVAILLAVLLAALALAHFYGRRDPGAVDTYRVVWHEPSQTVEVDKERVCTPSGRPGFVLCEGMDPLWPCLLKTPVSGPAFVACGRGNDNTLDDAPETWSR